MKPVSTKLNVVKAVKEDVYKDIVRIHQASRGGIREGSICRVKVANKSRHLIVRGLGDEASKSIVLDEINRNLLGVQDGASYDFEIKPVGVIGQLIWACTVADPGARLAAWIAIWSFILSLIGIALSVAAFLCG